MGQGCVELACTAGVTVARCPEVQPVAAFQWQMKPWEQALDLLLPDGT